MKRFRIGIEFPAFRTQFPIYVTRKWKYQFFFIVRYSFREFCSLMVKREREKETVEDLKQAFRVFDKVNVNI